MLLQILHQISSSNCAGSSICAIDNTNKHTQNLSQRPHTPPCHSICHEFIHTLIEHIELPAKPLDYFLPIIYIFFNQW